jgi:glucokinase
MILAGDIGGTKCNLAAFAQRGATIELVFQNRYATRDFSSFEQLVRKPRATAAQKPIRIS